MFILINANGQVEFVPAWVLSKVVRVNHDGVNGVFLNLFEYRLSFPQLYGAVAAGSHCEGDHFTKPVFLHHCNRSMSCPVG